ncbi:Crp/Fnr family transcriptional regulator [Angustibacter sp. McL0619]|uniref:Crp/Fnr family transcriptional regulator n=1 Tax=Angustibacter sp. McL0619 TaxID=3415676 RepID=UPI003CF7A9E1
MVDNDLAQLAACPLFAGLDPPGLEWLRAHSRPQRLAKGQLVFAQGEPGDCLHVLCEGAVSISVRSPEGGEMVLAVLRPPSTFGEISIMDGGPRVAGATALVASRVFTVPRDVVLTLLGRHPEVATVLMASMVALIRAVDEQVVDLVLLRLSQRVAKALLREALSVAGDRQVASSGELPVEFTLNQSELARKVGASRQAVNRELAELEHAGAIERAGHRVVAVRPERLARVAADAGTGSASRSLRRSE